MSRQPRVRPRGRRSAFGARPWPATLVSLAAVLAMGVLTFPEEAGVVWARIDRAGPPAASSTGRSATTDEPLGSTPQIGPTRSGSERSAASRMRMIALPATIAVSGTDVRIPVTPAAWSGAVVQAPADPAVVGRWMAGSRPGVPGRVVITIRRDAPAGSEASAVFDSVAAGDRIQLTGADGRVQFYQVTDRRELGSVRFDGSLVSDAGGSDLVVVTCTGRFDSTTNGEDSSVVISAGAVNG